MLSFWWNFNHWLHRKLSFWQLSVQPVIKISSKWRHFCFSGIHTSHTPTTERDGGSNFRQPDCLFNNLFKKTSKKTPKLRISGPFLTGGIPPHKEPVIRETFPCHDVVSLLSCTRVRVSKVFITFIVIISYNSLVPDRCHGKFKSVIPEHIIWIKFMSTFCKIALWWMPILNLCGPISITAYGVTRPQWVKHVWHHYDMWKLFQACQTAYIDRMSGH